MITDETSAPIEQRRCQHLIAGSLPKHSTLRLDTVADADNTTDYRWRLHIELCVLCSGFVAGRLPKVIEEPPVLASKEAEKQEAEAR